jgi:phage-related minor tail protein
MAGKTIEATLRLASDFAKALADLRALRKEAAETKTELQGATPGSAAARVPPAARKAATDDHAQLAADKLKIDKAAAAEALAQQKATLAAQREAERKAARERRQAEDEERRARRKAAAQAEREDLASTAAKARAEREARRKLTLIAPQVTDIVTGLASGQNPGLVAIQQGGQLRDLFGGFGNAARAVLSTLTLTRVVVGGIAAGMALVVTQIVSGHRESEQLRRTLALTGNAGGTSLGLISSQARAIASEMAVGIGTAREALASLLTVSGQTASTMGATGRAVVAITRLTGQSAEEAVKQFDNQADGVTDWSIKANKAYNFLTEAQVAYIRRLESQGRTQEAIRFANDRLADTLKQRTAPALGTLERGWAAVTRAMSNFLDKLKEIGRDTTAEDRLKALDERVAFLRAQLAKPQTPLNRQRLEAGVANAEGEQNTLRRDQARQAEAAISLQAQQDAILQHSKEMQASLTAVTLAEAQKRVAGQMAALDRLQSAVELADAQGLLSERAKATALNRIDQDRLRAQVALGQKQLEAARAAVELEARPQDRRAAEARVLEAQAQLVGLQSRLQVAISDAQRIVEADNLAKSRERAQAWADIWLRADQQVRDAARDNALTDAANIPDPAARAAAEAQARVQELRRQLDETVRDLRVQISLAISPESRNELHQQLGALLQEGFAQINEATRRAQQDSVSQQIGEQLDTLRLAEQGLSQEVERGALTTEEAERRKFAARAAALPQLRQMFELLQGLATTDAERNTVAGLLLQLDRLADKTAEVERTLKGSIGAGFGDLFESVMTGAERADRAFGSFLASIARSMLNLIGKRLGEQLVNSLFNSSGNGAGNGLASFLSSLFVATKHSGGLVDGAVTAGRSVAPWVFSAAQVLHNGGIAGLAPDEQPAILRKGEEVLTADDPRHINNLRGGGPLIGALHVTVSTDGTGTAAGDAALARSLAGMLKSTIEQKLAEELRPGGMLQNVRRG